jgi:hypothetical protein
MNCNGVVERSGDTESKMSEIEVMVEGEGLAEVDIIRIPAGSVTGAIVAAVAVRGGFPVDGAALFIEDCEDSVDLTIVVVEEDVAGKVHHVHRAHKIEVGVFYQGRKLTRRFAPSVRVQRVLDWAVGTDGFRIDPPIAPEMELALHGQTTALPKNAHIGRYIRHPHCELDFDLIRGIVPNGASL